MSSIEKEFVPAILTAQWKQITKGKNARFRSHKFKDSFMHHFRIESTAYFYQIINGHVAIDPAYIKFAQDLLKNIQTIR